VAIEDRETVTNKSLPDELLTPQAISDSGLQIESGFDLNLTLDEITKSYVKQALIMSDSRLKETAVLLGVNYRSLRYLIDKFELKDFKKNGQNRQDPADRQLESPRDS